MTSVTTFALLAALLAGASAQQASSASDQPKAKAKKSEATAKSPESQESAAKPSEPPSAPSDERKPDSAKEGTGDQDDKEEHYDVTEVPPVVTHHQITVDGKVLKYTATAGRLPIKRADGKTEAEMFFVAYTLDGQDASKRPLTFAFNGGPGAATVWLHMGALGPKRVVMQPDGLMPPAPYHFADNPSTLVDKSDLVFVDAIGTGFSRAANAELLKKFWSVRGDIEAFGEFIRLYLIRNERWGSPLFLFGESYGTTRAAGIAGYLSDHGISFNGITLLSTALTFQTLQ
jgi:carboxypeptidase C (cathepsin A)